MAQRRDSMCWSPCLLFGSAPVYLGITSTVVNGRRRPASSREETCDCPLLLLQVTLPPLRWIPFWVTFRLDQFHLANITPKKKVLLLNSGRELKRRHVSSCSPDNNELHD